MATEVLLPKQGNSVESCIILEWKKEEGDTVTTGEPIVEVETDKATFEVESTADGVLLSRLVGEGDDVPVLAPIAIVGKPGEVPSTSQASEASGAAKGGSAQANPEPAKTPPATDGAPGSAQSGAARPSRGGRTAISPRARKLAHAHNISHDSLTGSGPNGRIMVKDVQAGIDAGLSADSRRPGGSAAGGSVPDSGAGTTAPTATAKPDASYEEIPVTGIRKIIAERMLASLTSTAQFTMNTAADARRLLEYRKHLKSSQRGDFQSISINDLVMFAVSRAMGDFPEMNATFSDGVIRRYASVNLGFAVDTDRGLMVPVITGANRLSLVQLAAEAHRLADACKTMKARPEDLSGATFSVTNLGAFGIQSFTPVLDPPQVGILGVGAIEPKPVIVDGSTTFVPSIGLSLTINHQIVDGAPGARFLKNLAGTIAEIDLTLAQ
jgi:pyruvate dehydrogenase E2 component (dihydrolipoyllysine-residue acetyltransferase)